MPSRRRPACLERPAGDLRELSALLHLEWDTHQVDLPRVSVFHTMSAHPVIPLAEDGSLLAQRTKALCARDEHVG